MLDKTVKVYVYETDRGAKLLGPAARNLVYVYDGNVLGVPQKGMERVAIVKKARERGISTRLSYLDAVASLAAAKVEEAVESGEEGVNVRVRIAKRPSDVNVRISDVARRYVTGKKRKIDVAGPVFIGVRAEIAKG